MSKFKKGDLVKLNKGTVSIFLNHNTVYEVEKLVSGNRMVLVGVDEIYCTIYFYLEVSKDSLKEVEESQSFIAKDIKFEPKNLDTAEIQIFKGGIGLAMLIKQKVSYSSREHELLFANKILDQEEAIKLRDFLIANYPLEPKSIDYTDFTETFDTSHRRGK